MAGSSFILFVVASVLMCIAAAQPVSFRSQVLSVTNDDCLGPSNGTSVANSLVSGTSNFVGLTRLDELASAASSMLAGLQAQYGFAAGHVAAAYYGFNDGSFYMIRPCALPENIGLSTNGVSYCADTPYIFSVRNNVTLFADQVRHIFALSSDGTLGANLVNETTTYDPTLRYWYQNPNSWVSLISAATFGVSLTYSETVAATTGVVIGVDRSYTEPCNACIISQKDNLNAYIVRSYANTFNYGLAVPLANAAAAACPDYSLIPTAPTSATSTSSVSFGLFMAAILLIVSFF
jgi:hypothetical protein